MEKSIKTIIEMEEKKIISKPIPTLDICGALSMLRESQTSNKIQTILTQNNISLKESILRLDIEGNSDNISLELDQKDIYDLFSKFGTVENVNIPINQKSIAIITMKDYISAYLAQQVLNSQYIDSLGAKIFVKWISDDSLEKVSNPMVPSDSTLSLQSIFLIVIQTIGSQSAYSQLKGENADSYKNPFYISNIYTDPGKINKAVPSIRYTCKFDLQIENDKEFQIIRKLSGAKSCNLRRIVDLCAKNCTQEVVKIRIKGKGAEQANYEKMEKFGQQTDEPLVLIISSKYYDKYLLARHLCKELILNVYEDYKRFCDRTGKEPIIGLQVKMSESISGIRSKIENIDKKEEKMQI